MRETYFINQNKKKWEKFEQALKENKKDPENLSNLFMEITDDLSYSRTFYPNRSVRVYLNNLAQNVFYSIYRNKKIRFSRFWHFWKNEVPQILFESRFDLLLSFIVFTLAISIGVFSSMMDSEFPRIILGDNYVDMTIRNIENGRPMSVYQSPDQASMFLQITFNNLKVAFITFALGLIFSGGTIYILIYNGIMVGAFQYLFFQNGVYLDSVLTIWLHGAIEISSIVIAGAAGIHLGRGLLFPGTYTRFQGLQLSARRALLIFLTIVPLIIIAGFIESFITRYSDASYIVRAILILASFFFMIGYFVIIPYYKARRGFISNLKEVNLPEVKKQKVDFSKIKNSAQLFTDTFILFRNDIKTNAIVALFTAVIYSALFLYYDYEFIIFKNFSFLFFFEAIWNTFLNIWQVFSTGGVDIQFVLNVLAITIISYPVLYRLANYYNPNFKSWAYITQTAISTLVINGFIILILSDSNTELSFFMFIFLIPFLLLWLTINFNEGTNLFVGFMRSIVFLRNFGLLLGTYIVFLLMFFVFQFISSAPILGFFNEIILSLIPLNELEAQEFNKAFQLFFITFNIFFILPIFYYVVSLAQLSFKEIHEAGDLKERIIKFGQIKKSYGMEKENNDL